MISALAGMACDQIITPSRQLRTLLVRCSAERWSDGEAAMATTEGAVRSSWGVRGGFDV